MIKVIEMVQVIHQKAMWTVLLILSIVIWFGAGGIQGQTRLIPDDEMAALREIAEQLGKKDWNLSLNQCDEHENWYTPVNGSGNYYSCVNCTCRLDGCHISAIQWSDDLISARNDDDNDMIRSQFDSFHRSFTVVVFTEVRWRSLRGQDLPGVLPKSIAKLPYLRIIDLNRNYLSGSIPPEWASTKLDFMAFGVNRLSGTIPKYLGRITTLKTLSLESNMFNGTVPAELGNLVNLQLFNLNSNNLTGELPKELNNLINLREVRLSSNYFTGKLPSFQSWKQLQILELEASGFEGPIPSDISLLRNLTELRITDLNGGGSNFSQLMLNDMTALTKLKLGSCNISGKIPPYLVNLPNLTVLDLSYNMLEGHVPDHVPDLTKADKLKWMYLTRNFLTGDIPSWITSKTSELDFAECLKNSPCPETRYDLHINCGGPEVPVGKTTYEADEYRGDSAKFMHLVPFWGFSSTGHFWDVNRTPEYYVAKNMSVLTMNDSQLYTRARLSPLSLTYYGRCLANGNYTVTLHFAEIIFRDNRSYWSLGRRMFDIYIQDIQAWKDFDIEAAAKGVDKAAVLTLNNVTVKNNTIEIRFYWAGKGTRNVPIRGTYGPLVSAISVVSNFKPPSDEREKISTVIGAVASAFCLILVILFIFWWKTFRGSSTSREQELRGLDLQTGLFTFRQIKAATNDFDINNKIGEGGFGSVYKGVLLDGSVIAVKQLSSKSKQGNREFVNEIGMISGLQHPNLVRLYGCCIERNQLLLVYEYMENNSLARALFGECQLNLEWPTRLRICIGIARGLAFLHEESRLKIVHRDIKATNVLLDGDLNPKISDFGLAKLSDDENTHISTRIAGTRGYMAPEYALWGYLTDKADVYSFGVVALEIVAGKDNMKYRPNENYVCLLDWALVLRQKGRLMDLVDPKLGSNLNKEEAMRMIKVALLCTNASPALRPTMSTVVSMLEGKLGIQELVIDPRIYGDDFRFVALRDKIFIQGIFILCNAASTRMYEMHNMVKGNGFWWSDEGGVLKVVESVEIPITPSRPSTSVREMDQGRSFQVD
ncbi:hypothetical protein Vadar_010547 [Vaccinium darrowii]|uniref:Uncharacterized protein n=1 Tax=Vaccinium darrowii TaxID=229202 RepID=A0ACB7Z2S0_9ERIC|nr:hypothetical protein Vadar_010547 [Vaccinium darrowii]